MENVVSSGALQSVAPGLPDAAFWAGRRVLVTGHTGFIGGWMCAWLDALGCDVTGFALAPPSSPSFHDLTGLNDRINGVIADIRSAPDLRAAFTKARPHIVVHLAAQPIVREAYERPAATFDVNLMGTVHVLEAARQLPPDAVVAITSDKVYADTASQRSHAEADRLGPSEPYGSSKACCELAIDSYAQSFLVPAGVGVASVRAGNVIGGGDWGADRLVPDAVRAFSAARALSIRRPHAVRPWQHVLDAVNGLLLVAERAGRTRTHAGAWNIGPPPGPWATVGELAQMVAGAWREGACVSVEPRDSFPETHHLAVDSDRARRELAAQSPWPIARAVSETVGWYKRAISGEDAWAITQAQIAGYCADRAQALPAKVLV